MDVIGRVDTMAVRRGHADRLRHRRGGVVRVTAEAGIGKTTA
jgi:hypothetical protein